jgi:D-alanyl-D-alanine carboxypeptidase
VAIMDKPAYKYAQWGLVEVSSTGQVIYSLFPGQFFIPGSTAKLVSESAAWDVLGPARAAPALTKDCRFELYSGTSLSWGLASVTCC